MLHVVLQLSPFTVSLQPHYLTVFDLMWWTGSAKKRLQSSETSALENKHASLIIRDTTQWNVCGQRATGTKSTVSTFFCSACF